MKKLPNIPPGEVLNAEFLIPLKMTSKRLAVELDIPQAHINEILNKKRRITVDLALRLSQFFGTTAKFWLGLQNDFDIEEEYISKAKEIESIEKYQSNTL